ncbi:MAG: hypothetical protein AAB512_03470 [Patescibacteria group bacterium]
MSKQVVIVGGAVVVIAIVAIAGFFMMSKLTKSSDEIAQKQDSKSQESGTSVSKSSIKSLLGGGKNVNCKITYPENGGSGNIYVSDKKFRGDFVTSVGGKSTETHVISDGEFMYSWYGTTGTKFKVDAVGAPSPAASAQPQSADLDKQVDMDCSSWGVDGSKFTVPTDVKFTDLSEMMKTQQSAPTGGAAPATSGKSYCDAISDAQAKAACKSSGY